MPTTSGTDVFGAPVETRISTRSPFWMRFPGFGFWSNTRSFSTSAFAARWTSGSSPAF
jgi:hypothetical protein